MKNKVNNEFNKERLKLLYNDNKKDMIQRFQIAKEEIEKAFELDSWYVVCLDIITSLKKHNLSNDALGQLMMEVFSMGKKAGRDQLKKRIEGMY